MCLPATYWNLTPTGALWGPRQRTHLQASICRAGELRCPGPSSCQPRAKRAFLSGSGEGDTAGPKSRELCRHKAQGCGRAHPDICCSTVTALSLDYSIYKMAGMTFPLTVGLRPLQNMSVQAPGTKPASGPWASSLPSLCPHPTLPHEGEAGFLVGPSGGAFSGLWNPSSDCSTLLPCNISPTSITISLFLFGWRKWRLRDQGWQMVSPRYVQLVLLQGLLLPECPGPRQGPS